jgi:hypothetical protein
MVVVLTLSAAVAYTLLPKHYQIGERMLQTAAFWNKNEAFFFLTIQVSGRSTNLIQEKLAHVHFAFPLLLLGWNDMFYKQDVIAYHLLSSAKLDRFLLSPNTTTAGSWALRNGKLQLTPAAMGDPAPYGFRWDGHNFVPVPPTNKRSGANSTDSQLTEDDLDEEPEYPSWIEKSERQNFRNSGWHIKTLNGFESKGRGASLPLEIDDHSFRLIIRSFPLSSDSLEFGALTMGARSVEISDQNPERPPEVLWNQTGWIELSKTEYQSLAQQYGRRTRVPAIPWVWLLALVGLMVWKFVRWGNLLFAFGGAKRRILKYLPTTYSFPPASAGQFPGLDVAALDRYTREFEALGFTRLLDFSLVGNSALHAANFCRLLVHSRNYCFAEISQSFAPRKAPLPLKCSINASLQEGWTITFANRKPQPAASLLRRPRAIAVSMPEAQLSELLQAFLKMRDQVSIDLGVSPAKDDTTIESYFAQVQRTAAELRAAVQRKNIALGLSEVYYRRFSLLKTRPEYLWLGDYPKLAEQRKQGYAAAYGAKV